MRIPDYGICEQQRCESACFIDSIIPLLATAKISRLQLASEAEQAGLT